MGAQRHLVAVFGSSDATESDPLYERARRVGTLLVEAGYGGVMEGASRGAVEAGGAAHGYIVLHGKSGTLAELTFVWALHRAGRLGQRPVVLLGDAWRPFLHHLVRGELIEDDQLAITRVAEGPEDAVMALDRFLVAEGARGE